MTLLDRMANELAVDKNYVQYIAKKSDKFYRVYSIPKKKGGDRTIYHPSPILKTFQYWLNYNVFVNFPVSDYSYAYGKGCSIKKNAQVHVSANHLLHIDLKNFFESITDSHLRRLFNENEKSNLSSEDIDLICNLCLFKGHLTIGGVCSPILSNLVMFSLDNRIAESLPSGIKYSRYADDMVFSSTNYIDYNIVEMVSRYVNEEGFCINPEKTFFMSNKCRKQVTGLILDNGRISIGLNKRKEIKKMLYKKLRYNVGDSKEILGHLYFLKDIEPQYFNKIILKYSSFGDVLQLLLNDSIGHREVATTSG